MLGRELKGEREGWREERVGKRGGGGYPSLFILDSQVDVFNENAPSFRAYCQSVSLSYVSKVKPQQQKANAKHGLSFLSAWVRMVCALLDVSRLLSNATNVLKAVHSPPPLTPNLAHSCLLPFCSPHSLLVALLRWYG